jgi:hypothetical protein
MKDKRLSHGWNTDETRIASAFNPCFIRGPVRRRVIRSFRGFRPPGFPADCRTTEKTNGQRTYFPARILLSPYSSPTAILLKSYCRPAPILPCKTPRKPAETANSRTEEKIRFKTTGYAPAAFTA